MTGGSAPAAAKINLALHVLGRRDDGYHRVETLIAFAAVGDRVSVRPAAQRALGLGGPFGAALAAAGKPEQNLAWRAADAFAATFGGGEWAIRLDKALPLAAGIGGGSADAAAVLRLLAGAAGVARDDARLVAMARRLGVDVPACLAARPCIATGIGEVLEPLSRLPDVPLLLANPSVAVPTAAVFQGFAGAPAPAPAPIARGAVETAGDAASLAAALEGTGNMLQPAAIAIAPQITTVLAALADSEGCRLARMSGSGATCFALFDGDEEATAAATIIGARYPGWWLAATRLQGWP